MLCKNELLEVIAARLAGVRPNWEEVVRRFRETRAYRDGKYQPSNLASWLSEIHLREALERICRDFDGRVIFDPIKDRTTTENFSFLFGYYGNIVIKRKDSSPYSELDALLLVDGLPVMFEIKIKAYEDKGRVSSLGRREKKQIKRKDLGSRVTHPSSIGVQYAMRQERIEYLLEPLREYFKSDDFGYVLITSSDQISRRSKIQRIFMEQNGILVPFYANRLQFRVDVLRVKWAYGL